MTSDIYYPNVALLLHGDGSNGGQTFIDDSLYARTPAVLGNVNTSTAQSKWGGSSIKFDGSGAGIKFPYSPNLNYGTGPFTVECWINLNSAAGVCVYSRASENYYQNTEHALFVSTTGVSLYYGVRGSSNTSLGFTFPAIATGTWHQPTVSIETNGLLLTPGMGSMQYVGHIPSLSVFVDDTIYPSTGHLTLRGHRSLLIDVGIHDGNIIITSVSPAFLIENQFNDITIHGSGFTEYSRVLVLDNYSLDWQNRLAISYPEQQVIDANTITARVFAYPYTPGVLIRVENFLFPFTEIPAKYRIGPSIFTFASKNQDGSAIIAIDKGETKRRLGISTDYGVTWNTLGDPVPATTQIFTCVQSNWSANGELADPTYWSVVSDTGAANDFSGYYRLSNGAFDFIEAIEWGLSPYQQWPNQIPQMSPYHLYRDGFSAMWAWPSAELYPNSNSFFYAGAPSTDPILAAIFEYGQTEFVVSPSVGGTKVAFFDTVDTQPIYLCEGGAIVGTIPDTTGTYEKYGYQIYLSKDGERAFTYYYRSGQLLSLDFVGGQKTVIFDAKEYTGSTAWIYSFTCSDDSSKFIVNGTNGVFVSKDYGQHWRYKPGRQFDPPVGESIGAYLTFDGSVFREYSSHRERTEDFFSWAEYGIGFADEGTIIPYTGHLFYTGYTPDVSIAIDDTGIRCITGHLIYSGKIAGVPDVWIQICPNEPCVWIDIIDKGSDLIPC